MAYLQQTGISVQDILRIIFPYQTAIKCCGPFISKMYIFLIAKIFIRILAVFPFLPSNHTTCRGTQTYVGYEMVAKQRGA